MIKSFLQSGEWEEFQESLGRKVWRVENQLVIKYNLPLFNKGYLCCFRPNLNSDKTQTFLNKCRQIAKEENCVFVHLESNISNGNFSTSLEKYRHGNNLQPKQTLILDISKSEDEILAGMHHKTRYNIRLAEKKGVKVRISRDPKDVDLFFNLAKDTASRSNFHFHSKKYYQKMIEILSEKYGILDLFVAEYNNKALSAIIVLYHEDQAIYLHGVSSNEYRNLMAPYLAQWTAIKKAKKRGCSQYDFWGTAPLKIQKPSAISHQPSVKSKILNTKYEILNTNHSWAGITRFKLGFAPTTENGKYIHYPDCIEMPYQKIWCKLYNFWRRVRGK